jgi:hypothetical protein
VTRAEALAALHSEAVKVWTAEEFRGERQDAQRIAAKRLGFTPDLFPEVEAGEAFRPYPGELFG